MAIGIREVLNDEGNDASPPTVTTSTATDPDDLIVVFAASEYTTADVISDPTNGPWTLHHTSPLPASAAPWGKVWSRTGLSGAQTITAQTTEPDSVHLVVYVITGASGVYDTASYENPDDNLLHSAPPVTAEVDDSLYLGFWVANGADYDGTFSSGLTQRAKLTLGTDNAMVSASAIVPSGPYQGPYASFTTDLVDNVAISAAVSPVPQGSAELVADSSIEIAGPVAPFYGSATTRWQFVAGPASGGHELALTEARQRKLVVRLTEPSEASFSLDGRRDQASAVGELSTDLHVLYTPPGGAATVLLYRGRVGATGDSLDADSHTMSVATLDYRAVLNRRILYSNSQLTWTATDQADIARGLLAQTQIRPGGDLGIDPGTLLTGTTRDRTYEAGDSIGERIQQLSEVIDGFDWDITPTSASGLRLDIFYPQRGVNRAVVLEHGGLVQTVTRNVDPGEYANAIRMTGSDSATTPPTPAEREAADIATVAQGRWDKAFGEHTIETQAALDARADWQLAESQVIQPSYTLGLRPGAWEGPDHIWVGDTVRLVIYSGRLSVDTQLRVHELGVDIGDDGTESVSLTVGRPAPDYRRLPRQILRRLTSLERR
jgi:hypothetical protein